MLNNQLVGIKKLCFDSVFQVKLACFEATLKIVWQKIELMQINVIFVH